MSTLINVITGERQDQAARMHGDHYANNEWLKRCTGKTTAEALTIVVSAIKNHGKTVYVICGVSSGSLPNEHVAPHLQEMRMIEQNVSYIIERMNLKGFKVELDHARLILKVRCDIFQTIED